LSQNPTIGAAEANVPTSNYFNYDILACGNAGNKIFWPVKIRLHEGDSIILTNAVAAINLMVILGEIVEDDTLS